MQNQQLTLEEQKNKLLQKAYGYLNIRDHTSLEIYNKLHQYQFKSNKESESGQTNDTEILIREIIQELKAKKYISNEKFADNYIQSALQNGKGPLLIQRGLLAKGITRELWLNTWAKYESEELSACKIALEKWLSHKLNKHKLDTKMKIKAQRFLLSRGFHSYIIHESLAKLIENCYP